jgi:hypothetical protein
MKHLRLSSERRVINKVVNNDQNLENKKSEADEAETKDLATSVGNDETLVNIFSAQIGRSNVGEGGDSHSDVACNDRGETTNQEGNGCVELTEFDLGDQHDRDGEQDQENA